MYCPNCGQEDLVGQSYCRVCGLRLGEIAVVVAELLPSKENAALQKRKRMLERTGQGALLIAGGIALMSFIFAAALYKLILFGPEILFLASAIAFAAFAILGAGLFGYSKFYLPNRMKVAEDETSEPTFANRTTGKLIEDRPFDPVPTVVENTTDLLPQEFRSDQK